MPNIVSPPQAIVPTSELKLFCNFGVERSMLAVLLISTLAVIGCLVEAEPQPLDVSTSLLVSNSYCHSPPWECMGDTLDGQLLTLQPCQLAKSTVLLSWADQAALTCPF